MRDIVVYHPCRRINDYYWLVFLTHLGHTYRCEEKGGVEIIGTPSIHFGGLVTTCLFSALSLTHTPPRWLINGQTMRNLVALVSTPGLRHAQVYRDTFYIWLWKKSSIEHPSRILYNQQLWISCVANQYQSKIDHFYLQWVLLGLLLVDIDCI